MLPRETDMRAVIGAARYIQRIIRAHKGGRWNFDLSTGYLTLPAVYSTGTVSVANGGTAVTGSSTLWVTNSVTAYHTIILGGVEYPITTVGGETSITLATPYVGTTLSGSTYTVLRRDFPLASDCERLYRVWDLTNQRRVYARTKLSLDESVVQSGDTGNQVCDYSIRGLDSSGNKLLRFYPAPQSAAKVMYVYEGRQTMVSAISDTVDLPDELREVFQQGVYGRTLVLLGGATDAALSELRLFYSMLEDAWRKDQTLDDLVVRFARMDEVDDSALWTLIRSKDVDTSGGI